ncbi:hypothetical protein VM98_36495, partial [Streptomyces rubellomurinus subsp. indigoferus]
AGAGPWKTSAAATTVRFGSAGATTPRVTASGPRLVCATAGPALEADNQVTTCTNPFGPQAG